MVLPHFMQSVCVCVRACVRACEWERESEWVTGRMEGWTDRMLKHVVSSFVLYLILLTLATFWQSKHKNLACDTCKQEHIVGMMARHSISTKSCRHSHKTVLHGRYRLITTMLASVTCQIFVLLWLPETIQNDQCQNTVFCQKNDIQSKRTLNIFQISIYSPFFHPTPNPHTHTHTHKLQKGMWGPYQCYWLQKHSVCKLLRGVQKRPY
jgi:hypothetical protein